MSIYGLIKYVPLSVLRAVAYFVAMVLGKQPHYGLMRSIRFNLMLIDPMMPRKQRHRLAQQALTNQLLGSVESAKSWAMPPQWSIEQIRSVHNLEILQAGLRHPNGMLAIVPHLGTWEIMNAWLSQFGAPTVMYKPTTGALNDFMLAGRQRLNATLVPTDSSGVKAIFKTLKQGGFSILLPDHVPDKAGGVIAPFFGLPTLSSTLASKLASKTKCAMIGLACIRRVDGTGFDVHCYNLTDDFSDKLINESIDSLNDGLIDKPAKESTQHDIYSRDITVATTALNLAMQRMITPFMPHYMWGYRRFKYVPFSKNPYNLSFHDAKQARLELLRNQNQNHQENDKTAKSFSTLKES